MLKSLIHFEFIFVYGVWKYSNFNHLHVAIQFSRTTYWRDCLFSTVYSCILCHRLGENRYMGLSLDLLSCSINLCFCFCASCCCCSVTKLCLILCDPMDCSTPDFPALHYLPEFAPTHVLWVGNAIQPAHPVLFLFWYFIVGVKKCKWSVNFVSCYLTEFFYQF